MSAVALHAFDIRVDIECPEAAGKGFVGVRAQAVLIAEEDDVMVEEGLLDPGEGFIGNVRRQINAADLCAERAGDGGYGEANHLTEVLGINNVAAHVFQEDLL